VVEEEDEDQGEDDHAQDLEDDSGVVDDGHYPDTEDAQQSGAQQDEGSHVAKRAGVGADVHSHVVEHRDQDQRHGGDHGGHGEDPGEEVDPPGEPRKGPTGEVLRPLVDRARDREVRADLGEVESDDQLADDDDGPAPVEERPGQEEAEDEKSEDAGAWRDVREGDREARIDTQRAPELLLVAELLQVADVSVMCRFQGFPSPYYIQSPR